MLKISYDMKEKIYKLIELHGIDKTSKIVGLSIVKILEISNYPIDCEIAYEIIQDMGYNNELLEQYNEFVIDYGSFEGVISWDDTFVTMKNDKKYSLRVLATPFWDSSCLIPINVDGFWEYGETPNIDIEDRYDEYYKTFKIKNNFENIIEFKDWLLNYYYPKVYNEILKIKQEIIETEF